MNYRHAFHAGNFADVFKHALLSRILVYMTAKDRPLRYIDTHAGIGAYDLASPEAIRGGEWRDGVGRLESANLSPAARELLAPWLSIVRPEASLGASATYPGSPALAMKLLRPVDKMIFCEAHPKDVRTLRAFVGRDRRVKVVEIDGYMALRAYTPPAERRGLVLIDPPFEALDELDRLRTNLLEAWSKWPTGSYAIWRPLKDLRLARAFDASLAQAGVRDILRLDLHVRAVGPSSGGGLAGSGLLIVNPPWVLEDEARQLLPELTRALAQDENASWLIERIAEERR